MTTQRERDREQAVEELERLEALIVEQFTEGTLRPLTIQARVRSIVALLAAEDTSDKSPLKPCPFCGSDDLSTKSDYNNLFGWVLCNDCKAKGPKTSLHGLDDGDPSWNNRKYLLAV